MDQFATKEDIKEMSRDVLRQVFLRMDDESKNGDQKHIENQTLMREMVAEQRKTNGRVTRLEVGLENVIAYVGKLEQRWTDEFNGIRKRWHDFRDSIQTAIGKTGKGELSPLTRLDAKTAVAIYVLGMVTLISLLKIVGKL